MPVFKITGLRQDDMVQKNFLYDSDKSLLTDEFGNRVVPLVEVTESNAAMSYIEDGKKDIRTLKIQLGLSCNFSCEYCNQRFVPHAEETHKDKADEFLGGLDTWLTSTPERIEFWGGEPFVYWKTLKPLAEALRKKFPGSIFTIITNGSVLDDEKVDWLDKMGFFVSVSHDGPGQHVRGPDPLSDPKNKEAILSLYNRLAPQRRFSFNAMMNRSNISRAEIQRFFEQLVAPNAEFLSIGEGSFIDAYDEGGAAQSLSEEDAIKYRNLAFAEIRAGMANRFNGAVSGKIGSFVTSLRVGRSIDKVGQKCGMDKADQMAVDLNGNVLTCQNVSSVSVNPSGVSHKIGHVSDLSAVKVSTATHWRDRDECPKCPMIHICNGACLFLTGPLWETSCDNAFSDAVPVFAAGIEFATGFVPIHIEGPQREDRKKIWISNGPSKKQFPIPVVSA